MQTSVEPVDDHASDSGDAGATPPGVQKVRLTVTVPAQEFERAIDDAFRKLAREVRIDGFRPGKAPRRLLEARFGTEIAREQALRDALPEYYAEALVAENVDAIAPPEINITAGEDEGDVSFEAVVEVRPEVRLVGYDELRVELDLTEITDEVVDGQVDALRERFADLTESDRPLVDDDYATIDISATVDDEPVEGLTASDFLYRIGSGMVVPELDQELRGTQPGAILRFDAELPERFDDLEGEVATFSVIVKDAKKKVLPDVTDEWVSEVSEFDTVAELRADVAKRMDMIQRMQAQVQLRDKVLEAAAELVPIPAPESLVNQEARRRLESLAHDLGHRGLTVEQYLQVTGRDQESFVDELKAGAAKAVLADLALRAVVTHEAIEATDEELDAEILRLAERMERKPAQVRKELERQGAVEAVRSDIARGKALEFLVEHAQVVGSDGEPVDLSLPEAADAAVDAPDAAPSDTPDVSAGPDQPATEPADPATDPAKDAP